MKPREFTLGIAAWAPEGRLVAYEGQMIPPENGLKIKVIEKSAYDKAIAALKDATDIIHSEFCGNKHHPFCNQFNNTLKELGVIHE